MTGVEPREVRLPSGGTATLRAVTSLKAGDKIDVVMGVTNTETGVGWQMGIRHGVVRKLVTAWQVPYLPNAPLPQDDPPILRMLEIDDYDALMNSVAPAIEVLFPSPATLDDADKPGSPTGPASD